MFRFTYLQKNGICDVKERILYTTLSCGDNPPRNLQSVSETYKRKLSAEVYLSKLPVQSDTPKTPGFTFDFAQSGSLELVSSLIRISFVIRWNIMLPKMMTLQLSTRPFCDYLIQIQIV